MAVIVETPRLVLRHALPGDAGFLLELMNEPAYHRHIGDRGLRTVADAESYIEEKYRASYLTLGFGLYIVETKAEAVAIGICGFVKRDVLEHPDIGFAFLERYCGHGFGFESATAALTYGRISLGFTQLFGVTSPRNVASIRLLEKLGFSSERTVELPGYSEPSLLFSKLLSA